MINRLLKAVLKIIFRVLYRVRITGLEHFEQAGERVLIVANHTSFLDAVLLVLFLPGKLTFAINSHIARRWWLRPLLVLTNFFPMDPTSPYSTRSLIRYLEQDNKVVIFPEGRITVTGSMMKVYPGSGMVAEKSGATVIPVRINGAQYSPFSRLRGRVRTRWFPDIQLVVQPPQKIEVAEHVRGRERRKQAGQILAEVMTEMMFATSNYEKTIFQTLLDARRLHGGKHIIVEDIERKPISYNQLISRAFIMGHKVAQDTTPGERVGVLLPSMTGTVISFFGMHAYGRVPVMLNYSVGAKALLAACGTACLKTIYTSRQFIKMARLEDAAEQLAARVRLVYVEDLRKTIALTDLLRGWLMGKFAYPSYRIAASKAKPDDAAVVLFTSGSEGVAKGVVLSHKNLLANRQQIAAKVDFGAQDIILNALPLFHSFGLTAGTLLPLLSGMRTFFYPSPLHYRIVPEMAYEVNATIMFGTNTFLAGYARFAHPYDFYSMRFIFAGAEKLQEETRRIWAERFGVRIFEGYGTTETSPVLTSNSPMENRPGTVGRFMPGIEYRLDQVPGVSEGGRLSVRGPNVMLGYLFNDRPGELVPPKTGRGLGWYDTGDIVAMDDEGFVRICGRAKRFAKIGGEMVSLAVAEEVANKAWPDKSHAVVSVPHPQKGEQLVLVSECADADRSGLLRCARQQELGELSVPRKIIPVAKLPVLGSGKTDYVAITALAKQELGIE